jgi:hypothetical protein
VPFVDALLRRGHLSDRGLVEAWQSGSRPPHLDRCEICLTRVVELTRWLDDVRDAAVQEADAAFPPERLAAQHAQIFRRLEHLDRPTRLLAFPGASQTAGGHEHEGDRHRRLWPGWIAAGVTGVAAGLILGVFADRVVNIQAAKRQAAQVSAIEAAHVADQSDDAAMLIDDDFTRPHVVTLSWLDDATPRATATATQQIARTGR